MNSNEFLNSRLSASKTEVFSFLFITLEASRDAVLLLLLFCVLGAFLGNFFFAAAAVGAGVTGRVCLEVGGAASFSPDVLRVTVIRKHRVEEGRFTRHRIPAAPSGSSCRDGCRALCLHTGVWVFFRALIGPTLRNWI